MGIALDKLRVTTTRSGNGTLKDRTKVRIAASGPDPVSGNLLRLAGAAREIIRATGQSFYVWDISTDRIEWTDGFTALAGLEEGETRHLTGRGFETLTGSESSQSRYGVILSADRNVPQGKPVPYQCVYSLISSRGDGDRRKLWIEDTGVWIPGENGRPVRAEGSVRVINERRQIEDELRRQSDYDDLTGLFNRRSLEHCLQNTIQSNAIEGTASVFMIVALERFDLINDVYGFACGDEVLRKCGELIKARLRGDDVIARFSGAKFGVILNNCPPAEIYDAAKRLLKAVSGDLVETSAGYIAASAVTGACFLPQHAATPSKAIHAAFQALKQAKNERPAHVGVYAPASEAREDSRKRAAFSTEVVEAIRGDRLQLAYQPVVGRDGKVAFHEALIRMENTSGEIIQAGHFIGMVEELGLVRLVDKTALQLVTRTLLQCPDAVISFNVSHETLLDPEWLSNLANAISVNPDIAKRLIVEITESAAAIGIEETRRFVETVKALGCRVAIDDFGAGFTSFSNLRDLPVDMVKIDGSFGMSLASDPANQAFVKALLSLAHVFDIETVVEWVEDDDSSALLDQWDVDYQQGHKFGRAVAELPWPVADNDPASATVVPAGRNA